MRDDLSSGRRLARTSRSRGVLAALVLAIGLAACGGKSEGELIASAKDYLGKKDPKAAAIQLKNALEKNPSSAEGRFLLGKALLDSGDPAGAEVELRRALDLKYPAAQVVPVRAQALLAKGEAAKVTEEYGATDLGDPLVNIELQTTLAIAYAQRGMAGEARTAVDKALAISANYAPAVIVGARLTAAGGDLDGALKAIDGVLARAPDNVEALQFKAELVRSGKGDVAGAVELYRKVLAVRPDMPEAHSALVTLLLGQRDFDGAKKQFAALKALRPTHVQTQLLEAQIAFAEGNFRQARELLQALLRAAPDNARALTLAGATELQLGSVSQAESMLSRAMQLAPNSIDVRRLLAESYLRMRQPARALGVIKPVLELKEPPAEVLALAAQAYLQEGDTKTAEALFTRAAKLKPDDKRLNAALALSQLSRGNADTAFGELQRLAEADKGRAVDMALISARMQRREFDAALKAIDALERKQPDNPVPYQLRGRVYLMKQDVASARKAFEQALAKDPKYLPAAGALAALDARQNDMAAAQERFNALLKLDPKNIHAMLALAALKQRIGAPQAEVAKVYADAVATAPADPQPRLAQIDYLASQRDTKAALVAAQAGVEAIQNNVELLDRLARLQLGTGDRQQAVSSFGKITSLRPESALGHLGLAAAHLQGGEFDAAQRDLRRALEKEPDSQAAHRMAVGLAMQQKRPQDAISAARLWQQRRPDDVGGYVAEGDVEASQKHWDAAITALRRGLGKEGGSQAATRVHAMLVAAQRAPEAVKFAEGWLKEHPKDALFQFYLGDAALQANNLPMAESRYLEVTKLQPANVLALNNVAWLQLQQKKPGARAYAERAYKIAPREPAVIDTLAMVLAAEREFAKAVELEKQAIALAGDAPGLRMNLARIYLNSGDRPSAKAELDALAKLGDKFPAQAEVGRLLKLAEGS